MTLVVVKIVGVVTVMVERIVVEVGIERYRGDRIILHIFPEGDLLFYQSELFSFFPIPRTPRCPPLYNNKRNNKVEDRVEE